MYKVKNLRENTRPAPVGCRSWLKYWEVSVRHRAGRCNNIGCFEAATDGAHVQLEGGDESWWIVPMCHKCNCQFGQHRFVKGPLVSATDPKQILGLP